MAGEINLLHKITTAFENRFPTEPTKKNAVSICLLTVVASNRLRWLCSKEFLRSTDVKPLIVDVIASVAAKRTNASYTRFLQTVYIEFYEYLLNYCVDERSEQTVKQIKCCQHTTRSQGIAISRTAFLMINIFFKYSFHC